MRPTPKVPECLVPTLEHVWAVTDREDDRVRSRCVLCALRKVEGDQVTYWMPSRLQPQD